MKVLRFLTGCAISAGGKAQNEGWRAGVWVQGTAIGLTRQLCDLGRRVQGGSYRSDKASALYFWAVRSTAC